MHYTRSAENKELEKQRPQQDSGEQIAQDINTLKTISLDQNQATYVDRRFSGQKMISNDQNANIFEQNSSSKANKRNSDDGILNSEPSYKKQFTILQNKKWQYVAKFIQKIKQQSSVFRFTQNKKSQFNIIDDKAFFFDYFYFQGRFINEDLLPSRIWSFVQFIFLFIYIIYLPIRVAFNTFHQNQLIFFLFEVVPNITQILNIAMKLNTGFYKRGVVITNRKAITKHYLQSMQFKYDLLFGIFWIISLNSGVSLWFKAIGILRVITFLDHLSQIEQTTEIREYIGSYLDLIKLGGFIFLCAHLTGCCWYALAQYEIEIGLETTWLQKDLTNYEDFEGSLDMVVQGYVASFYWSIITMCTVGYGDIIPTTFRERIFVVFVCLLASFTFAFSMNSIGEIIKNLRSNNEEFIQQITQLKIYMKKRKLSSNLQMRVRKYYEYLFAEKKQENEVGTKLIDDLAPSLRSDVLKEIYSNIFKKQKLFRLNFSDKFITSLYKYVKEQKLSVDEYVYKENENADSLYFILSGEVEIILQGRMILQTLTHGEFVGCEEFFGEKPYQLSAKVNTFTQFLIINKKDFLHHLSHYSKDYESYCQIKDNVNLQKNTSSLCIKCESCGLYGHTFQGCQLIKFHGNKYKQIFNYNKCTQQRKSKERLDFTFATLECRKEVEESVKGFHEHIYFTQLQRDENEKKDLKNFSTIDDEQEESETEEQLSYQPSLQQREQPDKNIVIQNILSERNQNQQTNGTQSDYKNLEIIITNSYDKSLNNPISQPVVELPITTPNTNSEKKFHKMASIFARKQFEEMESPQTSFDGSEVYDINNPTVSIQKPQDLNNSEGQIQEVRISETPNKKQQHSSAIATFPKDKNKQQHQQLSYFFQQAIKEGEQSDIVVTTHTETHVQSVSKDGPKSKQHITIDDQIHPIGSQKMIVPGLMAKLYTKKADQINRRKSRYVSIGQLHALHKQASINVQEMSQHNSPAKHIPIIQGITGIFSPKNPGINSPHIGNYQFNYNQKTPTITPKQSDRRGTLRNQTQFSNSIASVVQHIYEEAVEQEDLIKKPPSICQEVENDMDKLKEYEFYFINNNCSTVISNYNKYMFELKRCQDILKENNLRKKKKILTYKTKYEKKNFNLLNKRNNQSLKHHQTQQQSLQSSQVDKNKKLSVDWTKQYEIEAEKPQEINKQELDVLIGNEEKNY